MIKINKKSIKDLQRELYIAELEREEAEQRQQLEEQISKAKKAKNKAKYAKLNKIINKLTNSKKKQRGYK